MNKRRRRLAPGDMVVVKSASAIMATLDERGCLDGMPFMPEMLAYCGHCLPVWRRLESVCEESKAMRRIRRMVFLGNLRCNGSAHDGCEKACRIFWHEDWLEPLGQHTSVKNDPAPAWPYPTRNGTCYFCQSTALREATQPAGTFNLFVMIRDVWNRTWSTRKLIRSFIASINLKARSTLTGKPPVCGDRLKTESTPLNLKPGEWVRVKSRAGIAATLDRNGRNRGLEYSRFMLNCFGQTYRVRGALRRIILESNGRMQELRHTVTLEGNTCDGHGRCGGCPRDQFHFWRECWLERVSRPPGARTIPAPTEIGARIMNDDDWDALVDGHQSGTIFHTSGWRKAMEATFPQFRGYQFGLNREGEGFPVYMAKSRVLGRRLINAPFATDCRPLIDESICMQTFSDALMRHFGAEHYEMRAVRALPGPWQNGKASRQIAWKRHRLDLAEGPGSLQRKLSRSNVRQRIRRARENGLRVVYSGELDALCEFYILFAVTRRRLGLPVLPALFFRNLSLHLPGGSVRISLVMQDRHPIAGLFALRYKDTLSYEYSGYLPDAAVNGANQLIWWDGIERACAEGLRTVSLGCTAPDNPGLLAYKRHWGGAEEDLHTATLTRDKASTPRHVASDWKDHAAVRRLLQRAPEPIYRGLSRMAYRYWC